MKHPSGKPDSDLGNLLAELLFSLFHQLADRLRHLEIIVDLAALDARRRGVIIADNADAGPGPPADGQRNLGTSEVQGGHTIRFHRIRKG